MNEIQLPKWPEIQVKGRSVTLTQANDIIFTTLGREPYLSSNDDKFREQVKDLKLPKNFDFHEFLKTEEGKKFLVEHPSMEEFHGYFEYLDLGYNIASCYVGGRVAWLNFDGKINYFGHNIGKWPTVKDVYNELVILAYLFPFLEMTVQLMDGEGCDETVPLIEYNIKDGNVEIEEHPSGKLFKEKLEESEEDFVKILQSVDHIPYEELTQRIRMFETKLECKLDKILNDTI